VTAGRDGEAGVTMLEMVVVVALLALVLGVAFQGITSYQAAASASDARAESLGEARLAMAVLTRDLRTATSFSSLAASDVTFLGNLNVAATAPPNRIQLSVNGSGQLVEAVTPPDDPTANPVTYTGTPQTRVVARDVVDAASLFSYRDATDTVTSTPAAVASVVVTLSVDVPAEQPVEPTTLSSRVWLPNVAAAVT
jgi:type II secretory pathway pseudopilin PulG